ncbi:MAG TPA: Spy/CpxP family protein refolding chaperone [Gammaproteobacteria bacterium]
MNVKNFALGVAPLLLAGWLVAGPAQADDPPRYTYGPGMMGGYGPGPGMMGRGLGYGRGMMWGDDDGRRGYGYGYGMHGMMEPWWSLDLDDKQRTEIDKIMAEQHKTHWPLMSRVFEAQGRLDTLYNAEKWDSNAINKAYDDLFKVQREMIESQIRTRNRIIEQLSPEQREQLKRYRWENRWRNQ